MASKGQISLEYMILTAFVVLVVVVPTVIWVYTSATGSVSEKVKDQQANDLIGGLADDAYQVYYLGTYSKKLVSYQLPSNIERLFLLHQVSGGKDYYYLGLKIVDQRTKMYMVDSKVPLTSEPSDYLLRDDSTLLLDHVVPECFDVGNSCTFYDFVGTFIKTGRRTFKVETVLQSDGTTAVSITPVIST